MRQPIRPSHGKALSCISKLVDVASTLANAQFKHSTSSEKCTAISVRYKLYIHLHLHFLKRLDFSQHLRLPMLSPPEHLPASTHCNALQGLLLLSSHYCRMQPRPPFPFPPPLSPQLPSRPLRSLQAQPPFSSSSLKHYSTL